MTAIVRANVRLLRDAEGLLRDLDDAHYVAEPRGSRGGGIGAQLRHVIDFYGCLLGGLDGGRIDYDRREREARVETDRRAACERLDALASRVESLVGRDPHAPLEVSVDRDEGEPVVWSRSSLDRELRFIQSHTIHHFALIGWMLRALGVRVPASFGLAPSTRRYWASLGRTP